MLTDKDGNKYYFTETGVFIKNDGDTRLKRVFSVNGGRVIKTVRKQNIMNNNDIGFSFEVLKYLNAKGVIKEIFVYAGKDLLSVKIKDILSAGNFKHFKGKGFEKQIFYSLNDMKKIK